LICGIEYIHKSGICHRDLKPENFLLKNRDDLSQLRMIDFGLSRYFEKGERLVTRVGTIYYTAPEVWSEDYDKTCDLWSAGVIMYVHIASKSAFLMLHVPLGLPKFRAHSSYSTRLLLFIGTFCFAPTLPSTVIRTWTF